MVDLQPYEKDVARNVVISATLALAVMICDFAWLIREEVKIVWPNVRDRWPARAYVVARYLGIISQIINVAFTVRMYLGVPTSPEGCRFWFAYQATVVQILFCIVEMLLMRRLWALFFKSLFIFVMLIMIGAGQVASMVISAHISFPSNKYTATCMILKGNPGNAFFGATTITTNLIIFFMTFWRYFHLPAQWTRDGIGRIVLRDSAVSLSAITVVMLFLTLCSLHVIKPTMSGNITFYWLVTILWISIGRIVINYENTPRDASEHGEGSTWKGTLQLTSQIEMGEHESTLSLDTQCASTDASTTASRTLQSSISTPATKASQLSPSSAGSSDSRWFGDCPSVPSRSSQRSTEPSSTAASAESIRCHSPSNDSPSNGDAMRQEVPPRTVVGGDEHMCSRAPSPQQHTPEPPPTAVSP